MNDTSINIKENDNKISSAIKEAEKMLKSGNYPVYKSLEDYKKAMKQNPTFFKYTNSDTF